MVVKIAEWRNVLYLMPLKASKLNAIHLWLFFKKEQLIENLTRP